MSDQGSGPEPPRPLPEPPDLPRVVINLTLDNWEVPDLREAIGWDRHEWAYPKLLEHVLFWAGARDEAGTLIAFAYMAGTGLPHGYLEDVLVHPSWQQRGLGKALVRALLQEAARTSVSMVTVSYAPEHRAFYEACGFRWSNGGLWTPPG
jgi:GNAT superfamily N-acetyltransferase